MTSDFRLGVVRRGCCVRKLFVFLSMSARYPLRGSQQSQHKPVFKNSFTKKGLSTKNKAPASHFLPSVDSKEQVGMFSAHFAVVINHALQSSNFQQHRNRCLFFCLLAICLGLCVTIGPNRNQPHMHFVFFCHRQKADRKVFLQGKGNYFCQEVLVKVLVTWTWS